MIQLLLKERADSIGEKIEAKELVNLDEFRHTSFRTPELYFGYKFAEGRNQLGNEEGFSRNNSVSYQIPDQIKQHYFYMEGIWENNRDGMKMVSDSGKILLKFNAKQVNLVADGDAILEIQYDGDLIPKEARGYDVDSNGNVVISEPRLYNVIELDQAGNHEIVIDISEPGFEIFTFTFG